MLQEQNLLEEQAQLLILYLAEAVTQFQAQAYKELLPADGPVRTQIMGDASLAKEEQSKTC